MRTSINITSSFSASDSLILVQSNLSGLEKFGLSKKEIAYVKKQLSDKSIPFVTINHYNRLILICLINYKSTHSLLLEKMRRNGNSMLAQLNSNKIKRITIVDNLDKKGIAQSIAEGIALGNYQFLNHKTSKKKTRVLNQIKIKSSQLSKIQVGQLQNQIDSVFATRDLVNEPLSFLTAAQMAKEERSTLKIALLVAAEPVFGQTR